MRERERKEGKKERFGGDVLERNGKGEKEGN